MISFRKMDVDKEPLKNCQLCDKVSNGTRTSDMYELQSIDFEANSTSTAPKLYLCKDCIVKMIQVNRDINK